MSGYDYSQEGAYFVTICTQNRECLFGDVTNGQVVLSRIGREARNCRLEIPDHFENAQLDEFVLMPNHLHGILTLEKRVEYIQPLQRNTQIENVGVQYIEPSPGIETAQGGYQHVPHKSIGSIIRSYKAAVTRLCRKRNIEPLIWQRNYYEPWPWPEAPARAGTLFGMKKL